MNTSTKVYSALFVDFDNMYIRLRDSNGKDIADEFASNPTTWLEWLEKRMSMAHLADDILSRHILIRKCYLNPASFGNFRPYFTRAAFEVIDCPKLTSDGKTSTDIHMVMDIMDALHHPSNFEEFILFSADADFTPVLMRVRQHKRLSVVVAAGYSSPAYKSACDYLPSLDLFLQQALGIGQPEEEVVKAPLVVEAASAEILHHLADVVIQKLTGCDLVNAYELPALYKRVEKFRESTTWLGYMSLRSLTQAIAAHYPELIIVDDQESGSWGIKRRILDSTPSLPALVSETAAAAAANQDPVLRDVAQLIIETVRQASKPVSMALLAKLVNEQFGSQMQGNRWFGAATFKSLLQKMDLDGLELSKDDTGYVFDPRRHSMAADSQAPVIEEHRSGITDDFKRKYPEIEPLANRIHQVTDMPYLLPEHYAMILQQIARAVNENGFQLSQTTRTVRDRCMERGAPVARAHVTFVVYGLNYAGYKLGTSKAPEKAETLAKYLYQNTLNLCKTVQLELSEKDKQLVNEWLTSCLDHITQNGKQ